MLSAVHEYEISLLQLPHTYTHTHAHTRIHENSFLAIAAGKQRWRLTCSLLSSLTPCAIYAQISRCRKAGPKNQLEREKEEECEESAMPQKLLNAAHYS